MDSLYFATTNSGKLQEAQAILGLNVIGTSLSIPEIQSLDPLEVAHQKALDYFNQLKHPVFIEDVSLTFTALGLLPGPYIDGFFKSLDNIGLCQILNLSSDRSALAQTTLIYIDDRLTPQVFVGQLAGTISPKPIGQHGFGWDPIFIPQGSNQTLAQMTTEQKNQISMRRLALEKLKLWLLNSHRV